MLKRGTVVQNKHGTIAVLLERASYYGWNAVTTYSPSPAYCQGTNIFMFDEEIKEGDIIEFVGERVNAETPR